jgi:hypothetical protein
MIDTRTGVELTSSGYHRASETRRFEFDPATTSASLAVVTGVTEVLDVEPTSLEPLHNTVDTDALDALVDHRNGTANGVHVTFSLGGRCVCVDSSGVVTVEQSADESPGDRRRDVPTR